VIRSNSSRAFLPGDADGVLDDADGEGDAVAADAGQVRAIGKKAPIRSRVMPSFTRISTCVPVASIFLMRGVPGKFLSMIQSGRR
jgi:hypothetical protein